MGFNVKTVWIFQRRKKNKLLAWLNNPVKHTAHKKQQLNMALVNSKYWTKQSLKKSIQIKTGGTLQD